MRHEEALDKPLLSLDIGLPLERLARPLRSVLDGASTREQLQLDAVNRRGRSITCTATILPLPAGEAPRPRGAAVLLEAGAAVDGGDGDAPEVASRPYGSRSRRTEPFGTPVR